MYSLYMNLIVWKMKHFIMLIIVSMLLFVGCSSAENSSESKSVANLNELSGTWEVSFIFGQSESFNDLFPQKKPIIKFDQKQLTVIGNTGCNSFSGSFVTDKNEIKFSDNLLVTEMLCIDGMSGEKAFLNTMKKINSYSVSSSGNTLYLKIDGIAYMKLRKSAE